MYILARLRRTPARGRVEGINPMLKLILSFIWGEIGPW